MYRINKITILHLATNSKYNQCILNYSTLLGQATLCVMGFVAVLPSLAYVPSSQNSDKMQRITHFIKWKELQNFPGYFISNNGLFKKGNVIVQPKLGKTYPYLYVFMNRKGRSERQHIHRLVWDAFSGIEKQNGYHIHHKDFNRQNNKIENLEYVTTMHHKELHRSHNATV